MTTSEDLKAALREVLESRGVLGDMRAKLRKEVFDTLDDKWLINIANQGSSKPELCQENLLLNELIREYLTFNHYNYSCSVLVAESGQPKVHLERSFLAKELNLQPDTDDKIPLLYHILSLLTKREPAASSGPHRASCLAGEKSDGCSQSIGTSHVNLLSKYSIEEPTITNSV